MAESGQIKWGSVPVTAVQTGFLGCQGEKGAQGFHSGVWVWTLFLFEAGQLHVYFKKK